VRNAGNRGSVSRNSVSFPQEDESDSIQDAQGRFIDRSSVAGRLHRPAFGPALHFLNQPYSTGSDGEVLKGDRAPRVSERGAADRATGRSAKPNGPCGPAVHRDVLHGAPSPACVQLSITCSFSNAVANCTGRAKQQRDGGPARVTRSAGRWCRQASRKRRFPQTSPPCFLQCL
jgi:hypothetical protein